VLQLGLDGHLALLYASLKKQTKVVILVANSIAWATVKFSVAAADALIMAKTIIVIKT
jgi:hypothetical protein